MDILSQYLIVLGLAVLPALGNFAGALLAEFVKVTDRARNYALHAAAGIVFGVVGIELMPRALEASTPWIAIVAYLLGGMAYMGVENLLKKFSAQSNTDAGNAAWMIYFAVLVDLFGDGILIGTASPSPPHWPFWRRSRKSRPMFRKGLPWRRISKINNFRGVAACDWGHPWFSLVWPRRALVFGSSKTLPTSGNTQLLPLPLAFSV